MCKGLQVMLAAFLSYGLIFIVGLFFFHFGVFIWRTQVMLFDWIFYGGRITWGVAIISMGIWVPLTLILGQGVSGLIGMLRRKKGGRS